MLTGRLRADFREFRVLLARLRVGGPDASLIEDFTRRMHLHMQVEEEELLPSVLPHLPEETGPVHVIREEHERHRKLLDELRTNPTALLVERIHALCLSHFAKEEDVLFPFAESLANSKEERK